MTREEVLERYQNQLIDSSEELEILSDIFLVSDNPKELVDKSYRREFYNNLEFIGIVKPDKPNLFSVISI